MPTYQYACTECGHAFEQFQSFSDDALTTCPECSGRLRKVFNAVGVVFKGSVRLVVDRVDLGRFLLRVLDRVLVPEHVVGVVHVLVVHLLPLVFLLLGLTRA